METWLTYGIYTVAVISILLALGGLRTYADTKDGGLLYSSLVSIGFSSAAIVYVHWAPLLVGFVLNVAISKVYPKYALTPVPPIGSEMQSNTTGQAVPDQSEFDDHVERELQGVTAPTEMMKIRPNEYLPGLLSEILVPTDFLLEKMTFNKQRTLGGPFFDQVAREVLYRWFSMQPKERTDDAHELIPDRLSPVLAMHLSSIFHHADLHVHCEQCDRWYDQVTNLTVRSSSSQVHAAGQERYACPRRHLVYDRQYHTRFVR